MGRQSCVYDPPHASSNSRRLQSFRSPLGEAQFGLWLLTRECCGAHVVPSREAYALLSQSREGLGRSACTKWNRPSFCRSRGLAQALRGRCGQTLCRLLYSSRSKFSFELIAQNCGQLDRPLALTIIEQARCFKSVLPSRQCYQVRQLVQRYEGETRLLCLQAAVFQSSVRREARQRADCRRRARQAV